MGQAVTTVIEGQSLLSDSSDAPQLHIDNGELATADTAFNVYVMKYLKETGQLTVDRTKRLQQNIESGKIKTEIWKKL